MVLRQALILCCTASAGANDTTLLDGDGLEYFGVGSGNPPYLNNTGDNITLYAGVNTAGTPLDYVAYGSGVVINGPGTGWSLPHAPIATSTSQSLAAIDSGNDTNNGAPMGNGWRQQYTWPGNAWRQ